MYKYNDIVKSLPKKKNSKSSIWVKLIVRRISFVFTYILINMNCSPWLVSMISALVALIGSMLLCINSLTCRIIGVIFIQIWLVLDCVDGNIARVKKESSQMGEFVDALSGYYVTGFVFFSIGVASFYTSPFSFEIRFLILILSGFSSVAGLLARLVHQKYSHSLMVMEKQSSCTVMLPETEAVNKKSIHYLRSRLDKEFGISGLFMPFLIIAQIFNIYDIMAVVYFVFQFLGLIAVTIMYSWKAR